MVKYEGEFIMYDVKSEKISKEENDLIKHLDYDDYVKAYSKAKKIPFISYIIAFRGHNIILLKSDITEYDAKEQIELAFEYVTSFGEKQSKKLNKNIKKILNRFINSFKKGKDL